MTQISERLLVQAHLDAKQPNPLTAEQEATVDAFFHSLDMNHDGLVSSTEFCSFWNRM